MHISSPGDDLHEMSKSIFCEKKKYHYFVVCWISPEIGKSYWKCSQWKRGCIYKLNFIFTAKQSDRQAWTNSVRPRTRSVDI